MLIIIAILAVVLGLLTALVPEAPPKIEIIEERKEPPPDAPKAIRKTSVKHY
jgi:hypothetical protein